MYDIVYADPPWLYRVKAGSKYGRVNYKQMSDKALKNLPISSICNKDSVCCMWATCPKLNNAIEVLEAWGFTYLTVLFTWVKINKSAYYVCMKPIKNQRMPDFSVLGGLYSGLGYYSSSNVELILLGKRGKGLSVVDRKISQVVFERMQGEHSKKPDIFNDKITNLFGEHTKKVELFARRDLQGWDCVGIEKDSPQTVEDFIEKCSINVVS